MSGAMSLWEYQAIVTEWNERQPKPDGIPEYKGPMPSEEDIEAMKAETERTVNGRRS